MPPHHTGLPHTRAGAPPEETPPEDEQKTLRKRKDALRLRARMLQAIRMFFMERDYLEVETPQRIPAPAPEPHIDAVASGGGYLHTSPELCMKRLLAAGYTRIFQISRCFRHGERGDRHLPEFTLLEWYRTGIGYRELMAECEALLPFVSECLGMGDTIRYRGMDISIAPPWERISVRAAFLRYGGITPGEALAGDSFEDVMDRKIEPRLGIRKPAFLYDYPAPLASLARLRPDDPSIAERFEIYMGGMELANGFSELTDAGEQARRFERDLAMRKAAGKEVYPMPTPFLRALRHMPDAAGIALGIDRLAMIFSGRKRIDDVVTFTPEEL